MPNFGEAYFHALGVNREKRRIEALRKTRVFGLRDAVMLSYGEPKSALAIALLPPRAVWVFPPLLHTYARCPS
jgi:hypothetical protein